ncbi:MAG TPA: hypothetical protein VNN25_12300 [Thermoanaerobaculia bacterium]|nr:hypothetical protein [Thermoanaerobaculia bacterium]
MASTSLRAAAPTTRRSALESLRSKADSFKPEDDEQFRSILAEAQDLFGMTDGDMATEFLVSRPTVSRWARGKNLPHCLMRRPITEWVFKEANRQLLREQKLQRSAQLARRA